MGFLLNDQPSKDYIQLFLSESRHGQTKPEGYQSPDGAIPLSLK